MACMSFVQIIILARIRHLNIQFWLLLGLLLISSLNPLQFMAQGREYPANVNLRELDERKAVKMRSLIGSRPPRCDKMCRRCGHCKAVQIPIAFAAPAIKFHQYYSRGDDISNYKPMCWKCKCGDFIFNPN